MFCKIIFKLRKYLVENCFTIVKIIKRWQAIFVDMKLLTLCKFETNLIFFYFPIQMKVTLLLLIFAVMGKLEISDAVLPVLPVLPGSNPLPLPVSKRNTRSKTSLNCCFLFYFI